MNTPTNNPITMAKVVAAIKAATPVPPEDTTSAQLVAAAPDMLEALNEIDNILTAIKCASTFPQIPEAHQQRVDEALTEARAAIRNATGENEMTMEHTPEPWVHDSVWGLINHGEIEICALHSGNRANASLIAAAPEMLEALRQVINAYNSWNSRQVGGEDDLHHVAKCARTAILKATGETG